MSLLLAIGPGSDATISAIPGNAVADGVLAGVNRVISTTPGNADAIGATAQLNRLLAAAPGNALADGVIATVTRTIAVAPGSATADGQTAAVTQVINATAGNASAAGIDAAVSSGSAYDIKVFQAFVNTDAAPCDIKVYQAFINTDATPCDIKVYQASINTDAEPYDIKVYQVAFNTAAAVTEQNSGGYEHLSRRQTPKQRKAERQRLGIIAKDIREATQKVARAVIVETGIIHPVRHFEQHREQFKRMLIQELKGYWSESLTDALYAQIEAAWTRKIDQENEEIILLLI